MMMLEMWESWGYLPIAGRVPAGPWDRCENTLDTRARRPRHCAEADYLLTYRVTNDDAVGRKGMLAVAAPLAVSNHVDGVTRREMHQSSV